MAAQNRIEVKKEGNIAWLVINRPEQRNALDVASFKALEEAAAVLDREPEVRAVVLRSEGRGFTAGIDLLEMGGLLRGTGPAEREELRGLVTSLQRSINALERCRKPVIAAIHGYCIGGGVDLACACDIRMASRDAIFSIRETRMGIIADLGTLQRLPGIVGQGWFMDLALTGRDFSAEEALRMGFITRLSQDREQLLQDAAALAHSIAALPPLTVQGVKDVALYSREHGVGAGLDYVAQKNAAQLPSEDLMEALQAFMEKRPAEFKGR